VPLNTMQQLVRSTIDGLTIPGQTDPLVAYIQPPTWEAMEGPRAYVWSSRLAERRQTMPRVHGFKRLDHTIDIYVVWLSSADDANIDLDSSWTLLLDAIMAALRVIPIAVIVQDQQTGVKSQLLAIGEDMGMENTPVMTPESARLLWYSAKITVQVQEGLQG